MLNLPNYISHLEKTIINYRNINPISFFNNKIIFFIINIYLDESQTVLRYLRILRLTLTMFLLW